jgi:4-hydroxymandelate oxidase
MSSRAISTNRRRLLQFLAASPLAAPALREAWGAEPVASFTRWPDPVIWAPFDPTLIIQSPAEASNAFDFEPACREAVPPAHFGYMTGGVEDGASMRDNREGFQEFQLLPRRLNDVSKLDMKVELFGTTWGSPVYACPVGGCMAYHPEGERAVSTAARTGNHMQMLSTFANTSIEEAIEARGAPVVFQLYARWGYEVAKEMCMRAEAAGSTAVAVTIDRVAGRVMEAQERLERVDDRTCTDCHDRSSSQAANIRKVHVAELNFAAVGRAREPFALTWDVMRRLRDETKMKFLVKGVMTAADATLCVENGFDGLVVSNHGGRAENSGLSTIEALSEIVPAVKGKIPVLVDSGFRRGSDVVKALAMGAAAVGIGRPYLWGLGAFGQEGVERVLEIVHAETRTVMAQCGAASVKQLTPAHVRHI